MWTQSFNWMKKKNLQETNCVFYFDTAIDKKVVVINGLDLASGGGFEIQSQESGFDLVWASLDSKERRVICKFKTKEDVDLALNEIKMAYINPDKKWKIGGLILLVFVLLNGIPGCTPSSYNGPKNNPRVAVNDETEQVKKFKEEIQRRQKILEKNQDTSTEKVDVELGKSEEVNSESIQSRSDETLLKGHE